MISPEDRSVIVYVTLSTMFVYSYTSYINIKYAIILVSQMPYTSVASLFHLLPYLKYLRVGTPT